MRQFDVIATPSTRSRGEIPWLVVLQSHHLSAMPTAVVTPMLRFDPRAVYSETSLVVSFRGEDFIVSVAELAAIDVRKAARVAGDLADAEERIRRALDRLFTGF